MRLAAAEALAMLHYPINEKALPALIRAIGADPDTLVRQRCIWSLDHVPDLEQVGAVKPLEAMLASTEPALRLVRYDSARMLARKQGPAASDKAVEILLRMVRDPTLKVYRSPVAGSGGVTNEDARYMAVALLRAHLHRGPPTGHSRRRWRKPPAIRSRVRGGGEGAAGVAVGGVHRRKTMPTVKLVDENDPDPIVQQVFRDIKETKKIDFIPNIWRALASHPEHLQLCWTR